MVPYTVFKFGSPNWPPFAPVYPVNSNSRTLCPLSRDKLLRTLSTFPTSAQPVGILKKDKKEKKKSKEKKSKKSKKEKDDMPAPSAPALAGSDTAGGTVAAPSGATSQTPAFSAGQLFKFNAFNHAVVYVVVVVVNLGDICLPRTESDKFRPLLSSHLFQQSNRHCIHVAVPQSEYPLP